MIALADVLSEVRRSLDEYTLAGELIAFDANVEDTTSSNFADEDLQDRALDGARYISARCKAAHLKDLVITINPTDESELIPPGATLEYPWLRLLGSRVTYGASPVGAERRTISAHMAATELAPSTARPIYCYEDYEFIVAFGTGDKSSDGNATGEADTLAAVVDLPVMHASDGGDKCAFDGDSWTSPTHIPMDEKFHAAIVYYVASSCFQTLRLPELAGFYRQNLFAEITPFIRPQFRQEDLPKVTQV